MKVKAFHTHILWLGNKVKIVKMRGIVCKNIMSNYEWEPKDFLLWMMHTEDYFDWMWYQWFECIRCCITDKRNDKLWIMMFHKHFHNEIQSWVDNTL